MDSIRPNPWFTKSNLFDILLIVFLVAVSLWYWIGVRSIPFHPDESTQLYMSADWETLFSRPASLAWQPQASDLRSQYRLLDAPLARYLVGGSRWLAGLPALPVDWNWSLSWQENARSGALPSDALLFAGRMGSAVLFPFSLLCIFLAGKRLGGRGLGWCAMLLAAANALVLLHTRRAMAEGGLFFTVCLWITAMVLFRKNSWLIALPAALAFCAKQSTLPLAGIGFLAVLLYSLQSRYWLHIARNLALYGIILVGTIFLLNPFLWSHPLQAAQAAVAARQELLTRQTNEFAAALPASVLRTPFEVVISILANLYLTPPAIADVGNYLAQTQTSAQAYLNHPLNQIFRNLAGGGILFGLSLLGWVLAAVRWLKGGNPERLAWGSVWWASVIQFLALIFTLTLPFQRYVIPLVPFTCLWAGWCLVWLGGTFKSAWIRRKTGPSGSRKVL